MFGFNVFGLRRLSCWLTALALLGGGLANGLVCRAQDSLLVGDLNAQLADQTIHERLRQGVSLDYSERPLNEVLSDLSEMLSINVRTENKVLADSGFDSSTLPISLHVRGISAGSALQLMLRSQGLTWLISDEGIVVTTREQADNELRTRVYLARDLVATSAVDVGGENATPLIDAITGTVATQTWDDLGGPGTIEYFANAGVLIVSQTREVHDEIEGLLAMLRKARGLQGLKPAIEPGGSVSADISTYTPPKRTYAVRHTWNVPQVHR